MRRSVGSTPTADMSIHVAFEDESSLELEVAFADPDPYLVVRLQLPGFSACTETYVLESGWSSFLRELQSLEATRQGEATVESISPGELQLRIRSLDRAGHMGIEGLIGMRGPRNEFRFTFDALEFDPTRLPSLVTELSGALDTVQRTSPERT